MANTKDAMPRLQEQCGLTFKRLKPAIKFLEALEECANPDSKEPGPIYRIHKMLLENLKIGNFLPDYLLLS